MRLLFVTCLVYGGSLFSSQGPKKEFSLHQIQVRNAKIVAQQMKDMQRLIEQQEGAKNHRRLERAIDGVALSKLTNQEAQAALYCLAMLREYLESSGNIGGKSSFSEIS